MSTQFPSRVVVIGGGRMGVGIAHSFAAAGSTVTVVEAGDLDAARKRLIDSLSRADERGKLDDPLDVVAARVEFAAAWATPVPTCSSRRSRRTWRSSVPSSPTPRRGWVNRP